MTTKRRRDIQTLAAETYSDGLKKQRPLSIPILQTVNFSAESSAQLGEDFRARKDNVYQRFGHPTSRAVAEKIAQLEGAEAALVFSSGMGAISTTLLTLVGSAGTHVVAQREIFAQTFTFLNETLRRFGVETTFVNIRDEAEVRAAIRPNTRLIYIESPSNPLVLITDIAAIARIGKAHNIPVAIDSTFASPALQRPLEHGADLVLHSATKFLAGHSDVLCGAVAGSRELIGRIEQTQTLTGSTLDPHAGWLLLRGIKTLGLRVPQQAESALAIARYLERHPAIQSVSYPFLESHPGYSVARKQMSAGGGVISLEIKGGLAAARAFVDGLEQITIATSLGGVESVIEIPYDLDFGAEELGEAAGQTGIRPGTIRLSVGIESTKDLLADIERALESVAQPVQR